MRKELWYVLSWLFFLSVLFVFIEPQTLGRRLPMLVGLFIAGWLALRHFGETIGGKY